MGKNVIENPAKPVFCANNKSPMGYFEKINLIYWVIYERGRDFFTSSQ